MMFCPQCGNENAAEAKFCIRCGYALPNGTDVHAATPHGRSARYSIRSVAFFIAGIVLALLVSAIVSCNSRSPKYSNSSIVSGQASQRTVAAESELTSKRTVVGRWENRDVLANYEQMAEEKAERAAKAAEEGKLMIVSSGSGFLECRAIQLYSDGTYEYVDFRGDQIKSGVYELIHDGNTIVFDGDSLVFDGVEFTVSWSGNNLVFSNSSKSVEYTSTKKALESYR